MGPCQIRLCRLMWGGGYAPPTAAKLFRGYARHPGLAPLDLWGQGRTLGRSPKCKTHLNGGHSRRHPPGGKAEAAPTKPWGKAEKY